MSLIGDTLRIEVLIDSMEDFIERKRKLREERENYDGYSFDYFYGREIDAMHEAAKTFRDNFERYIDSRVDARISDILTCKESE